MIAKNIVISEDSQEFIKPILPGLPISVFYTSFQENTYNCINWHWHEAFQYCLITEGTVDFLLPNTTHHVKEGDGIFINSNFAHRFCLCTLKIQYLAGIRLSKFHFLPYAA